ncbi:MAG: hypothetical protein LDL44_00665 [Caenispirillum sp.]|nr:hypothetical protein [Caenispirillum sp.]
MTWRLTWGQKQAFLETLAEHGICEQPEPPELPDELESAWEAFWVLSRSRPWTTVTVPTSGIAIVRPEPLPIPFRDLCEYADRFGVPDFETFHRLIWAADDAWMDHHRGTAE